MTDAYNDFDRAPGVARMVLILAVSAVAYLGPGAFDSPGAGPPVRFGQLASAFLRGQLAIEVTEGAPDELIPTGKANRYYCAYPPLPAVLLMPLVLLGGGVGGVAGACRVLSILNVLLFDVVLRDLPNRMGRPSFSIAARTLLTCFFAFGTSTWDAAFRAGDWHLAHVVALTAMLLALREFTGRGRLEVIGLFVGLAMLARPTTLFAGLFFVVPYLNRRGGRHLIRLITGPMIAGLVLSTYNELRFGSPFDFGYDRMLLRGSGLELMRIYGQFDQAFVFRNFYWFFLAPPWVAPGGGFPWLSYDPRGLSLFIASPAMVYALVSLRRLGADAIVRRTTIGIGACLIPLLLYFNTGFWQFGHRFSLDYMPLLVVLVAAGWPARPGRWAWSLVTLSILVHVWGLLLVKQVARLPDWIVPVI